MEQRLTIITLGVHDLRKATAFYEESFGWRKLASSDENITFFRLNGIQLALYGRTELANDATVADDGKGFRGVTISHNVRSESEVDAIFTQLKKKGVVVVKEPAKVFWGGYSGYVSDPDGNLWEIAFNPYLELDPHGNVV